MYYDSEDRYLDDLYYYARKGDHSMLSIIAVEAARRGYTYVYYKAKSFY